MNTAVVSGQERCDGAAAVARSRAGERTTSRLRAGLLSSASLVVLLASTSAFAGSIDCSTPSSSHDSCTVPSGSYTSTPQLIGEGDDSGDRGPDYTLTNNGTITITSGQFWGLVIGSDGHDGSQSSPAGGDGGNLELFNNGTVTVSGTSSDTVYGLYARSKGGDGNDDNGNGTDGGRGGDGGHISDGASGDAAIAVRIENAGAVTINQSLPSGGAGIFAETRAGHGGDQNSSIIGDQAGGNSGDAKDIEVVNSGTVNLGTSTSYLTGEDFAWGIAARARGNEGGDDNGKGGTGGNVTIDNSGTVNVYWNGTDGSPNGVRGIYGLSQGGDGKASNDDSDKGGKGEAGYQVQVVSSGIINVVSQQAAEGLSGGIVAISQGGDGGDGPGHNAGGNGGNASDTTGGDPGLTSISLTGYGEVSTSGDGVSGLIVRSKGGNGGDGQDGEKDSSGGDGGAGGAISVSLTDFANVITNGAGAYGVLGQSIGGSGGEGGDKAAVVGEGGGGGFGGDGGDASYFAAGGTHIYTFGNYSSAVAIQSIGGNGGTAGDFLSVLGGSGGDGGNGGDGGTVSVTSDGSILTTGGISHGILAQSIAGSGGTGDVPIGKLALGGDGGSGGDGGDVFVTNVGAIETEGFGSRGILAQSISGGGGDAGTLGGGFLVIGGSAGGGGDAGDVTVRNSGAISTFGTGSTGILAQSISGGGGSGAGTAGLISVGGTGGNGGDAGRVYVGQSGSISTHGDWANGITAQSIGGGGGDGGYALDFSILIPNVGVGGDGGVPGSSSDVEVGNYDSDTGQYVGTPTISTSGVHAFGILAQSIGGGGGSGGDVLGGGLLNFFTLQIGGDAADGAKGNDVRINYANLTLTTQETDGIGIVAQSIGGGGGVGGSAFSGTADVIFGYAVAVGGSAGTGGDGDTVTVKLTDSTIRTGQGGSSTDQPSDAIGILAQSIGGGGGIGGHALAGAAAAAIPVDVPFSLAATTSIGGSGGAAGDGDMVTVDLDDTTLETVGAASHGILAQSIGGGGGHAGMGWTYSFAEGLGGFDAAGVGVAIGGDGGSGGNGGAVNVNLSGTSSITTNGPDADGIVAQSVGGGGGDAGAASAGASGSFGLSSLTVKTSVGGQGGNGGTGGDVLVSTDSGTRITTQGGNSHGIVAQSIGGGGGTSQGVTAGGAIRVGNAETSSATFQGSLSLGLTGGAGGDAGKVEVDAGGTIVTQETGSIGIVAQSIGGGGGTGGSVAADAAVSGAFLAFYFQTYQLAMGVGGTGGGGGDGNDVTINQSGTITTAGDHAIGLLAQSIGGGGGLGGSSVTESGLFKPTAELDLVVGGTGGGGGDGQTVTADFSGGAAISTSGYMAHGAVLQSIGGGGGIGGDASDEAQGRLVLGGNVGGSGGSAHNGGDIDVSGTLSVSTTGTDAIGLIAQSVGGGGGIAGQGNATRSSKIVAATLELAVGGTGGVGGHGGDVDVGAEDAAFSTSITTSGQGSFGLLAQSVGGGGGLGGVGSADAILSLTLGGRGGTQGDGGDVSVYADNSSIITYGAGAHALVAQSVGGGGGIAGDTSSPGLAVSLSGLGLGGNGSGDGGDVMVDFNGTIQTTGDGAFGIFAQSIGGGGGFGGDASGSFAGTTNSGGSGAGGDVTVVQQGSIVAIGDGGVGIFAQSQGPDGAGTIDVSVAGSVIGNQHDGGAGVLISGGHDNVLTIGSAGYVSGNGGTAISYVGDGSTGSGSILNIYNYGTIDGDVLLNNTSGNAAGTVYNYSNHTLNAQLVEANVVNSGTMVVGGRYGVGATHVTGDFQQLAGGTLQLNADFGAGTIDHLTVDGDADLAGRVTLQSGTLLPRSLTFLEVGGAATGTLEGGRLNMFDFDVTQSGNAYSVDVNADFTRSSFGLSASQSRAAGHLQEIWDAGGGQFGPVFAALANGNLSSYAGALSALQSEAVNAPAAENLVLTQQHLDRLMSCPQFEGTGLMLTQTECVWAQAGGQQFDQSAFDGASGYGDTVYSYALGGQKEIAPNWFLGFSAAYDSSRIESDGSAFIADGDTFSAGLSLKHEAGPWLFAAAVTGSFATFATSRSAIIASLGGIATGSQDLSGFGARLRAAYTLPANGFYLRPFLDVDLIYTDAGAYSETGAGLLDRDISASSNWAALATPSLEIGTRFNIGQDYVLRGYARGGVAFSSLDDWTSQARLSAAPVGVNGFDVILPVDDVAGKVGAGLQLSGLGNGVNLRAEYEGDFSAHATRNMGSLRLSVNF